MDFRLNRRRCVGLPKRANHKNAAPATAIFIVIMAERADCVEDKYLNISELRKMAIMKSR